MTRTYGRYAYQEGNPEATKLPSRGLGFWYLDLEPAVRMRARRVFGRTQQTRTTTLRLADTLEVCRDLAWFMERYPLEPVDETAARYLAERAAEHEHREQVLQQILTGNYLAPAGDHTPAKEPRPYQQIAADLLRTRGRLLLTDEVGLGKTFTALLGLVHADALPALIVPPTHLPRRWVTELTEAFPWLTHHTAATTKPTVAISMGEYPDVLIVPYSKLDGWAATLAGNVRTVIFDEVQDLRRGRGTQKGQAAAILTAEANFTLGLTATPVYNYGGEIWEIYDILATGALGTREEFVREWGQYSGVHLLAKDPYALGSYLRTEGLMLGRTRKEVGRELPKTIKVTQTVDTNYNALAEVRERAKALAEAIISKETTPAEKMQAAGEIDWQLRRATGVDKAPFVADFVRALLESEERVVLWGWHRDVYEIWLERLSDFNPVMYTGSENPKQKAAAEDAFTAPLWIETDADADEPTPQLNPNASRLLIMSLRSGAGVDGLQKVCRAGVFGELDWSPQVHEQAIGRLRRDGMSDDPPVIYFLVSDEGSDPALTEVLQLKRQQAEQLVTPDGQLIDNSVDEKGRGRKLAEQILGINLEDPA